MPTVPTSGIMVPGNNAIDRDARNILYMIPSSSMFPNNSKWRPQPRPKTKILQQNRIFGPKSDI